MHCFQLVFQLTFYLVSKFTIYFNWYKKYKMFNVHWYLKIFVYFQLVWESDFIIFWYVLLIWKGSFTSSLYIDSCWVYLILRSLTALLYVIHVCSRTFTSPFIHCILCFMWLGFSHLFSYKCMYAGGVNCTSLLFMNVYDIYNFLVWFDKRRE